MTKKRLKAYRAMKLELDGIASTLATLESVVYGPKGSRLDGMPRSGSGDGGPVERAAIKLTDLREKYMDKAAALIEATEEVEDAIESLDERQRTLMRLYYIQGLSWEDVCGRMSYSWRQIHRIHSAALQALQDTE